MPDHTGQPRHLAEFLRSRRERLSPEAVGLPVTGRRRTPGLRREEVAHLSGVSVTWYTWLEQGRDVRASRQVLDALARTLRMSSAERAHLFVLAGTAAPPDPPAAPAQAHPTLRSLLDALDPAPAHVVTACWDVLAHNRASAAVMVDYGALPVGERNVVWQVFTNPHLKRMLVDWKREAQRLLAQFRAAAAEHPAEPRFAELTEHLRAVSVEFHAWWPRHDITGFVPARKRLDHPAVGRLTVDYVKLAPVDAADHRLSVYLPADEDTRAKLHTLVAGGPAGMTGSVPAGTIGR